MALPRILLIDDNQERCQQFKIIMEFIEYRIESANVAEYTGLFDDLSDVVAVFVGNGMERQAHIFKLIVQQSKEIPVIFLIDKGTALQISTAIQQIAFYVLEWPARYSEIYTLFQKIKSLQGSVADRRCSSLNRRVADRRANASLRLTGNSRAIENTRKLIGQVADADATVLILGESGTGKEVVARCLHQISSRRDKPFVPINCGAIPAELLESELFGHDKGAFTGALTARQGRFELADGGTLFLDEIGDMPMPMQVKLLRVLQERTFERVGSNKTIQCNVRVMAATHRQLEEEIKEKRFREDLFYRLNVFPIEVPALRDRVEDISLLVNDLIAKMQAQDRGSISFTNKALKILMQYDWPGNVRELANLIERMAILNPDGVIDVVDLPEKFQQFSIPEGSAEDIVLSGQPFSMQDITETAAINTAAAAPLLLEQGLDLKEYLSDIECDLINQALDECNGIVAHAAKRLNMRRTTLVEKLRKYDLQR
jgi:sigma-54 dependent transcriptional regulator, flagellar regulatory protein